MASMHARGPSPACVCGSHTAAPAGNPADGRRSHQVAHHGCAVQVHYSEQSRTKCIGLTIETRPDYCHSPHLTAMLAYGCTRIEMGVQSVYEDVARDTNRGHSVASVKLCFRLAKDAGFKVVAHMMPDLPNVGWERDVESFREFFENPDFRCARCRMHAAHACSTVNNAAI